MMPRTRYWVLKLILVPISAGAGVMVAPAAQFPPVVKQYAAVVLAASGALYALINEVPHNWRKEHAEAQKSATVLKVVPGGKEPDDAA